MPYPVQHLTALAMASLFATLPALATDRFVGNAFSREGDTLLYREVHLVDATRHVVLYQCPDGKDFARKQWSAKDEPTQPDVGFVDGRNGYEEGVRHDGDTRVAYVRRADGRTITHVITDEAGGVIDAGFDAWVRGHWDALNKGDLSVPFLVAQRGRFYAVKLVSRESGNGSRRIDMRLDAWYGFATPAVTVTYADASHQLLRYEGPGTIRNASDKPIDVRIEFAPGDRRPDAAPDSVVAALTAPLDGRCAD